MCGILFILSFDPDRTQVVENSLLPLLRRRGPDGHHTHNTAIGYADGVAQLHFHGTVLHLRGELTKQPLVNDEGHVLIWNGEIFGGDVKVPENANDTSVLFDKLTKLPVENEEEYLCKLLSLFATIQGPWAFVFYDAYNKKLWYGRDYFGRRSLMSSFKENIFSLSSLGHRALTNEYTEVPAKELFCLNVNDLCKDRITESITSYPMNSFSNQTNINNNTNKLIQHRCLNGYHCSVEHHQQHEEYENQGNHVDDDEQHSKVDEEIPAVCTCPKLKCKIDSATQSTCPTLKCKIGSATQGNVKPNMGPNEDHNNSNVIDNKMLNAAINHVEPSTDVTPLLHDNIGFTCCTCLVFNNTNTKCLDDNSSLNAAPDQDSFRCTSLRCKHYNGESCVQCTHYNGESCVQCTHYNGESCVQCTICNHRIAQPDNFISLKTIACQFLRVLEEAVNKRVHNLPRGYQNGVEGGVVGSKVGILFSGGIDSVVLTSLADRFTPSCESIDLINVAFAQKPKVQQNIKKKHQKPVEMELLNFDVPDRITGRMALKELSTKRKWNFIEVDVALEELQETRKSRITNLVYPLDSVLDDSIGCAIWFAARGVGKCYILAGNGEMQLTEENYKSPVKVLLTGMGADEQLGGYARHRTKFQSSGWVGLQNEMKMELERISSRNLGRDDRCISDHGREARFPFLDEDVVSFLQDIPVCVKCDPRLPRGVGEKILLREVAMSLGLLYASKLPKRAIQFGSKIAKLESSKEKGSDKRL